MFTKELDEALLNDQIDLGIHSMKDMPTFLPENIALHAIMPREDVRDAFISAKYESFNDLPEGATLGTASLRRKSQVLIARPDLRVVPLRGNVDTRNKWNVTGQCDALRRRNANNNAADQAWSPSRRNTVQITKLDRRI